MPVIKNLVLLLKSEKSEEPFEETDDYVALLTAKRFEVIQIKTLTFTFENLNLLEQKLKNPNDFSGIVFSSPRCVRAVSQALSKEEIHKQWKTKENFVVGEATYKETFNKLGLDCKGKETGNAQNLAKLIMEGRNRFSQPFLFPHGNLKTDTLKTELRKEELEIEGVQVYQTLVNPNIHSEFTQVTENLTKLPEVVVFFSPSGFKCSIEILKSFDTNLCKLIAIGPATEQAIKQQNYSVYSVAKYPSAKGVLDAILLN